MCDTRGHEHWCSSCGKNLNKEPKGGYIEIEWSQNDKGQIIEEKSMICKKCLEESDNIRELDKFFSELKYTPFGHVFCSSCKKDLTKGLGKDIKPGTDYECLSFKCHQRSGPNIRHIIKVVVLCKDCVGKDFNAENLDKLKKLGKNPTFSPLVVCDKIDVCKQYKSGDKNVNCKHIVIGRDTKTLHFGLLCGRRHKGATLLPFDDGFSISRPRKGKGAAVANPMIQATAPGLNPVHDYVKEIEKLLRKYKLGKFAPPSVDYNMFTNIQMRILNIEKLLGLTNGTAGMITGPVQVKIEGGPSSTDPNTGIIAPVPMTAITSIHDNGKKIKKNGKKDVQ